MIDGRNGEGEGRKRVYKYNEKGCPRAAKKLLDLIPGVSEKLKVQGAAQLF